jgi:hypothetical protein
MNKPYHSSLRSMSVLPLLASLMAYFNPAMGAEHIVLGRAIELPSPQGHCILGKTSAERELVEQMRSMTAASGRLLQVAVPCADIERVAKGTISKFPTMMTVRVIAARGQLRIDDRSRSQFLASLSKETIDIAEVNKRASVALANRDISPSLSSVTPLGRDADASYWAATGSVKITGDDTRKTMSVFAAVLINGLPVSLHKTTTAGMSDGADLASEVQSYVKQVIAVNDR